MITEDQKQLFRSLSNPFPATDIEWRVLRAQPWGSGIRCLVYPYVTARAIHERLDEVVGPMNWCNTRQEIGHYPGDSHTIVTIQVGIGIRGENGEWVFKYNVSEPTDIEPVKGGFSGAEKRAGEEWGIGRYLWYLGQMDAETTKTEPTNKKSWEFGKTPKSYGEDKFWWRPPQLPSWALPRDIDPEADKPVTTEQLNAMKTMWANKFAPTEKNKATKYAAFSKFCTDLFGPFPLDTPTGWTQDMIVRAKAAIQDQKTGKGPSHDVPFEE